MSKVKIQGNASGTGVLTVSAPNTSTDRTITLPDATGTLLNSDGDGSSLTGVADATKLPLAGGTLTGNLIAGGEIKVGTSDNGKITSTFALTLDPPTGEPIVFRTAGTDIARFRPGGGLCFGTDTAAANALDDYEEGTWSPDLIGHTGSAGSHAHNLIGHYIKIGGLVWVRAYGYLTNKGSYSGNARLNGFPFAPDNATAGTLAMFPSTEVDANMRTISVTGSTTKADFMKGSRLDIAVPWSEIVTSYYLSASVVYAHT